VTTPRDPRLVVAAVGGAALQAPGPGATAQEWARCLGRSLPALVELMAAGFRLVLAPAARPWLETELLREPGLAPAMPLRGLDLCAAAAQGAFGHLVQQVLGSLCRARALEVPTVVVVTRVVVDRADPGFDRPATPIGPVYPATRARWLEREHGWRLVEEAGRGHRRLVPAPRPQRVLEAEALGRLAAAGVVPIAAGAGVPVLESATGFQGVEAVVDEDFATARLAMALRADRVLFLTGVEHAAVGYGTPRSIAIERLTAAEARALLAAGEFPAGSMGPKVEAALEFVGAGGREAVITSPARARAALEGRTGTRVVA
jgi:carbamate kinase